MNSIRNSLIATSVGLALVFFGCYRSFLTDIRNGISAGEAGILESDNEASLLRTELETLQTRLKTRGPMTGPKTLLQFGEEGTVMKTFFQQASDLGVTVETFELLQSFFLKGKEIEFEMRTPATTSETLPQLDETGMPVGSVSSHDEEEWKGVEIIPMRFKVKGTYRSLGKFFQAASLLLPLHAVHSTKLTLDGSGIVKGTVAFVFPARAALARPQAEPEDPSSQPQPTNGE